MPLVEMVGDVVDESIELPPSINGLEYFCVRECACLRLSPKLRLFGQVILGLMWGFGGGGWFGSDYAAMVRGMVASMRSKARR